MAIIQWTNDLSVNVAELDKQHQKLVDMINDLNEAMRQGKGKDVMGKTLNDLIDYAATHFKTEEKYFEQYAYPATITHKKEHTDFARKVGEFKQGFDSGRVGISVEVMSFLGDWLRGHIKGVDKKYGPFFNEKGLK
jgi:hemerythrin